MRGQLGKKVRGFKGASVILDILNPDSITGSFGDDPKI